MVLRRKSGRPRSVGGLALAVAALVVGFRQLRRLEEAEDTLAIVMGAAIVGVAGGLWALGSDRQRITLSRSDATVFFEDGPWYNPRRSVVYARSLRAVEVEAEPSEVDLPPGEGIYRVVLCLVDGRRLPLTDYGDRERVAQQRAEILAYLPPGLEQSR